MSDNLKTEKSDTNLPHLKENENDNVPENEEIEDKTELKPDNKEPIEDNSEDNKQQKVFGVVDNTDNLHDFRSITENIQDSMPEPSEHVINSESQENETILNTLDNENNSEVFNPSLHRSDQEGNPILKKDGSYWKKPGQRKGSNTNTQTSTIGNIEQNADESQVLNAINKQNESFSKIGTLTAGHLRKVLGGEKADKDEKEYLESALKIWLDESEIIVNPNVGLAIALGSFFLPLVNVPFEKNVLMQFGTKIYYKVIGLEVVPEG